MTSNEPDPFTTSQPQPDPNCPAAAAPSLVLRASNEPKASSTAAPSAPDGALAPPGVRMSQKRVWFTYPPPLLRPGEVLQKILGGVSLEIGVTLQCRVQLVRVPGVMLGVMDLHGPGIDVGLQGIVCVAQLWKLEGVRHGGSSERLMWKALNALGGDPVTGTEFRLKVVA